MCFCRFCPQSLVLFHLISTSRRIPMGNAYMEDFSGHKYPTEFTLLCPTGSIIHFHFISFRYSKLAGESLAMGNANVTDLSDPNRPTKLAEQFSELYDNDWTDAFEELADLLDEEKINLLLKILQVCAICLLIFCVSSVWLKILVLVLPKYFCQRILLCVRMHFKINVTFIIYV